MSEFHVQLNHVTVRTNKDQSQWGYVLASCADPRFSQADVVEVHGFDLETLAEIATTIKAAKEANKRLVVTNQYEYKKEVQHFTTSNGEPATSRVVKLYLKGGDPVFKAVDAPRPLGAGNLADIVEELGATTEVEAEPSF